jgi:hypothetical protein
MERKSRLIANSENGRGRNESLRVRYRSTVNRCAPSLSTRSSGRSDKTGSIVERISPWAANMGETRLRKVDADGRIPQHALALLGRAAGGACGFADRLDSAWTGPGAGCDLANDGLALPDLAPCSALMLELK